MPKIFVANIASHFFMYKTKKLNKMAGPQLALPQPTKTLCFQHFLKYRRRSTNYYGSTMPGLLQQEMIYCSVFPCAVSRITCTIRTVTGKFNPSLFRNTKYFL